jgi:hypothetical protein
MAAAIAIGGFLARATSVLQRRDEQEVERATAIGGLLGLAFGLLIIVIDVSRG